MEEPSELSLRREVGSIGIRKYKEIVGLAKEGRKEGGEGWTMV